MSSSRRNSEVDFRDVFGGPPRRCSIHEFYNDGKHSFDSADDGEAEGLRFGFDQKPVFGDEVGTRRRYPSEDFFDDIFGGDQPSSCSQSPRSVPRRDPFSSAPGSRVMSPSRPLPPMVEPSASPTKFSLPTRLANTDFQASTSVDQSLSSAIPSMSRYNQTSQNYDVLCADVRLSYRPSPLSYQNSVDGKESVSNKMLDGSVEGSNYTKEDSKGSEVPIDSTQFHFSIYKWAGKGVPLVMSLRKRSPSKSKERTKIERCLSSRFVNDSLDSNTNEMPSPSRVKDREHCQSFDDINQTISEFVSCGSLQNVEQQVCEDEIPREVPNLSTNNSSKSPGKTRKSNVRPLSSFQEQENGNKAILADRGGKETVIKEKGQPSLDDVVSSRKINKNKVPQSSREATDDWNKKDNTRKVKEFVEILNQESSSKPTKNISGQNQSLRWNNDKTMFEAKNEAKPISTQKHNEMQATKVKPSKTLPEASNVIDGNSFLPGKQKDHVKNNGSVLETPSQASTNEQSADGLADFATNIDPTLDNDILSKELLQEIDITSEVEYQEETQAYERKIRNWSRGKEGNIRALLSTLQYVLWPNSGWKPVPLVDIIEANAVKRAYQKALLRLHPDKLQQKGAAAHQKFIAQQVFDILQEAWDHFNTLGTL